MAATKVLGLVGPIGAGKSAVAGILQRLGGLVLDADKTAHDVLGQSGIARKLVARWGPSVARNGRIRRDEVAKIVFNRDEERRFLERLVHPRVIVATRRLITRAKREKRPFAVIDAPLLLESGLDKLCDAVIYVDAPKRLRLERARKSKGLDEKEIARRQRAMWPLGLKRKSSAKVIRNDGNLDALGRRIEKLVRDFVRKA